MPDMHLPPLQQMFSSRAQPLVAWSSTLVRGTGLIIAAAVALVSYRYLLDVGPVPSIIAANRFRTVWLIAHVGFASTALLTGVVQFSGLLHRSRPRLHRRIGRVYAISCLIGAVTGVVLALGSSAGPIASVGFGALGIIWFHATWMGWQRARAGRIASHRRWMIRSWALTLAAVTLRIYIPLFEISGLPELPSYRAISFLCWVPNLLLAEYLLRRGAEGAQSSPRPAAPGHSRSTMISQPLG
jgi:uncharacterized membrane protein